MYMRGNDKPQFKGLHDGISLLPSQAAFCFVTEFVSSFPPCVPCGALISHWDDTDEPMKVYMCGDCCVVIWLAETLFGSMGRYRTKAQHQLTSQGY